jgi:2',3'-cyclic-nucleotide 2'-phosphodiesterase (5'-nucleotidase family)
MKSHLSPRNFRLTGAFALVISLIASPLIPIANAVEYALPGAPSKPVGSRVVSVTKLDGTEIAKDSKEYTLTTLDFVIYGGDGYLNVFSPAQAKVKGALLDIIVDALKADLAAGKVTQVPVVDGRIKKVG